jgi:hypothetical protein
LAKLAPDDDDTALVEKLYDLTDSLQEVEDPERVYPSIFEFMENYPSAETGSPGPLVHFIERSFPGGYERLSMDSLRRKPASHTLQMANRLLNSTELEQAPHNARQKPILAPGYRLFALMTKSIPWLCRRFRDLCRLLERSSGVDGERILMFSTDTVSVEAWLPRCKDGLIFGL